MIGILVWALGMATLGAIWWTVIMLWSHISDTIEGGVIRLAMLAIAIALSVSDHYVTKSYGVPIISFGSDDIPGVPSRPMPD